MASFSYTVVLLIAIAAIGGYVASTSLGDLRFSGAPTHRGQTLPAAQIDGADVAVLGGNPQRTGEMPGPGITVPQAGGCCIHLGRNFTSSALVDGVTYLVGVQDAPPRLTRLGSVWGVRRWDEEPPYLWENSSSLSVHSASSPAVANGFVYFGDDSGTFYALDAATGAERWRFAGALGLAGSPVVGNGTVYFATGPVFNLNPALSGNVLYFGAGIEPETPTGFPAYKTQLYAVDAITGAELWRYDDFPADSAGMYAFDAATGTVIWQYAFATLNPAPPRAVVRDGMVFFGNATTVYALDAETGEERWHFRPQSGRQPFCSTPSDSREQAYYGVSAGPGRVYFGTSDGTFYAFDSAAGAEIWSTKPDDAEFCGTPAIVGDTVYVANRAGRVLALDASGGREIWRLSIDLRASCSGLPVVHEGGLSIACRTREGLVILFSIIQQAASE